MVWKLIEISCSGFGRGGKMAGQQTCVGNVEGAGEAECRLRTGRVHCMAFKRSAKGD